MLAAVERINCDKALIRLYKELAEAIDEISALIRFQSMDVYGICETVFAKSKKHLPDFSQINGNFSEGWAKSCRKNILPVSMRASELFESAGSFLGQYDAETQLKRLSCIESELMAEHDRLSQRLSERKKLYYCVSGFAGMMLCLILL